MANIPEVFDSINFETRDIRDIARSCDGKIFYLLVRDRPQMRAPGGYGLYVISGSQANRYQPNRVIDFGTGFTVFLREAVDVPFTSYTALPQSWMYATADRQTGWRPRLEADDFKISDTEGRRLLVARHSMIGMEPLHRLSAKVIACQLTLSRRDQAAIDSKLAGDLDEICDLFDHLALNAAQGLGNITVATHYLTSLRKTVELARWLAAKRSVRPAERRAVAGNMVTAAKALLQAAGSPVR